MNSQVILELLRSTSCFWFLTNVLIFWPALRHQGWCQNIAQRSPKLFGKTSFLTLQTFLEHVQNMSKKCILSYHIMSYYMIWYHIKWYHMISYDMISYDIVLYDMISYDMIWYHMIWYVSCVWCISVYDV